MKLEDRLKESLARRAEHVRGEPDEAWSAIQERRRRRRRPPGALPRVAAAILALVVAAGGGVAVVRAFFGGEPPATTDRPQPAAPSSVDPRVAATVEVGAFPQDIVVDERGVWVVVQEQDPLRYELIRIDPSTNEVAGRATLEGTTLDPSDPVVVNGWLWATVFQRGDRPALQRYEEDGEITAHIGGLAGPLAFGEGALWATGQEEDGSSVLVRLDPESGDVEEGIPLGETVWHLTTGEGAVWVLTLEGEADILRVDAATNRVTARIDISVPGSVGPPAAGGGSLWVPVAQAGQSSVVRLDGRTGDMVGDAISAKFPGSPIGVAGGGVWFFGDRPGGQVLSRLNIETLEFDASLNLDEAAAHRQSAVLAPDGETIWVANYRDSVIRIDLLPEVNPEEFAQPRPNGPIAFEMAGDIYVANPDGSDLTNLTNTEDVTEFSPAWSPDGSRIAFVACTECTTSDLYVMDADGTNVTRITEDLALDGSPAWSPDGTRIVYASDEVGHWEEDEGYVPGDRDNLWVVNADGTGRRRLTESSARDLSPAWSPDGATIAFTRMFPPQSSAIYAVEADGSDVQRLDHPVLFASWPHWSPDGSQIGFTVVDPDSRATSAYVMNADGTGAHEVAADVSVLDWSPDGTKLLVTWSGWHSLHALDLETGQVAKLFQVPRGERALYGIKGPVWGPVPA